MAAILDFVPTMQYLKYFPTTPQCPAYLKNPWLTQKKHTNMPLSWRKWYQFIGWPWTNGDYSGFLPTIQYLKYFPTTPQCPAYLKNPWLTQKNTNMPLSWRKWYQFIGWPWTNGDYSGFLPTMQYLKYFPTTPQCPAYLKNPWLTQKNTNMPLSCRKWYQFIVWPWTNGGHLRFFTHNAISKIFSDNTTMSGIPENPMIDTKKDGYASIMTKMISIYWLTLDKWRPFWIFYLQCNVENIFWQCHCVGHTSKPYNKLKNT